MNSVPITVTVPHARELSGLGNTKIWELISSGELQAVRVGRRRLVLYASLEKLLRPGADNNCSAADSLLGNKAT
jgi:excisionase family DNA binding protein